MPPLADPALPPGTMARLTQPVLARDDLGLRPWAPSDASAVVDAYSDPGIRQWHVNSMTGGEALAWIVSWAGRWSEESGASWAITRGSHVVGQIGLRHLSLPDGRSDLSYWVLPEARGHGIAARALLTLSAWAFDDVGLHRLQAGHSTANLSSCRVLTKAGYRLEGTKRQEGLHADGWHDMHLHALLADDPYPHL